MTEPTPAPPEAADAARTAAAPTEAAPAAPSAAAAHESPRTDITAGPGGVMTDEVGVITGDLTLRTDYAGGKVTVNVQYKDAEEWYVVTGGKANLKDPADVTAVHDIVAAILNRPEG
ncbi:MAG: hypothetical protein QOC94_106 [Actinoplanes sp.]|jgi:hypothetical protein|nr:hypothetical protein [Actinoplanes sp.]